MSKYILSIPFNMVLIRCKNKNYLYNSKYVRQNYCVFQKTFIQKTKFKQPLNQKKIFKECLCAEGFYTTNFNYPPKPHRNLLYSGLGKVYDFQNRLARFFSQN